MKSKIVGLVIGCSLFMLGTLHAGENLAPKETAALLQKKCTDSPNCEEKPKCKEEPKCPEKKEKSKEPSRCEKCQKQPNSSKCKSAARKVVEGR